MPLKIEIQRTENLKESNRLKEIFGSLSPDIGLYYPENAGEKFDVFSSEINFRNSHEPITESAADIIVQKIGETIYPGNPYYQKVALINPTQVDADSIVDYFENLYVVYKRASFDFEFDTFIKQHDISNQLGKVFLTGAGPGGADLLTVKALELLHTADIVFYDNLISPDILNEIQGKKVFVGKQAGNHSLSQTEINIILLKAALKYKKIVRLKGGDPTIFGHAGEELAFLESRFIPVELIPGISSALAASALSTTPLTLRGVSQSVAFCSGHEKTNIQVPSADTLVYYMGSSNLKNIAAELTNHNFTDETPVKLVYNVGASNEEVYSETIGSILNSDKKYKSPLLTIIGAVADKQNWDKAFMPKKRILYTGTHPANYANLGYVTHHPMIKIAALPDTSESDLHIRNIKQFSMIIFTSAYAVQHFFERLFANKLDTRNLSELRIVSIGRHTSAELKRFGILPDYQPQEESSEGIINLLAAEKISGHKILLPRSDKAQAYLPEKLKELKNTVVEVKIYTNVIPENSTKVNPDSFNEVIFTSPSGVENFMLIYGKLPATKLTYKGKETLKSLIKFGYTPE